MGEIHFDGNFAPNIKKKTEWRYNPKTRQVLETKDGPSELIADVYSQEKAELISAAPDLLEACQKVLDLVSNSLDVRSRTGFIIRESILPAIEKAKGRIESIPDKPIMVIENQSVELELMETAIARLEMQMIFAALEKFNNNISKAAKALGLTRRGFYLKLEKYNIR